MTATGRGAILVTDHTATQRVEYVIEHASGTTLVVGTIVLDGATVINGRRRWGEGV